jgi:hypothetical protein
LIPNPSYTNESLSRTDFLRTVRDPKRCPSMQWSPLLLFLVEKARKQIYQSKSIPDVHKFVLRPKIFSAGSLTKFYAKERSPSPPLKRVRLTGQVCERMYVSILEFAGNGPKWRFRARQAAANFSPPNYTSGRVPSFSRWRLKVKQMLIFSA